MSHSPASTPSAPPLLRVEDLGVELPARGGIRPVEGVSFTLARGETLALVGESGCGKSLTALGLLGIAPPGGRLSGRVLLEGRDLLALSPAEIREVRGARVGFVFQEPATALNPVHTIGEHIVETLEVHGVASGRAARARAVELLGEVALPEPGARVDDYPHQLSGGMRQRAMLAIALACRPSLLVADEPTTALDATTQVQVLDLLGRLRDRFELALLLVSHDLGVVCHVADRVAVMYAGRIVEHAPVAALFGAAVHPYTRGLLSSIPGGAPRSRLRAIEGTVPTPAARPPGCAFAPRCPHARVVCRDATPAFRRVTAVHEARCVLVGGDEPGEAT